MSEKKYQDFLEGKDYLVQHHRDFDPVNPCANLSYEEMMEMYIADGDSGLIEFLNGKKENNTLSEAEEEYWKFAMDNGMTKGIFRKRLLEMHTEDRKKDPLNIKISRMIVRAGYEFYSLETSENNKSYEQYLRANICLKTILLEKLSGNKASIDTILDENDEKIEEQVKAVLELTKAPRMLENKNLHPFSAIILGNHVSALSDYYKSIMPQYVEKYMEAKREGRLSEVIPERKYGFTNGIDMRSLMGMVDPENAKRSMIQPVDEEWSKYITNPDAINYETR